MGEPLRADVSIAAQRVVYRARREDGRLRLEPVSDGEWAAVIGGRGDEKGRQEGCDNAEIR